jgi:hypothetical protein
MREMHVHLLPWPAETLAQLGETQVRLRVTLSYFIEPNPARLGWRTRHRYQSHGLRFDVKTPEESFDEFRKRLNKAALEEGEKKPPTTSDSPRWLLGDRNRHRGSLHADVWEGTAADLAARGVIGIYPVSGWWKDQPKHDRSEAGVRYALIVGIETDAEGVDVWTPGRTAGRRADRGDCESKHEPSRGCLWPVRGPHGLEPLLVKAARARRRALR